MVFIIFKRFFTWALTAVNLLRTRLEFCFSVELIAFQLPLPLHMENTTFSRKTPPFRSFWSYFLPAMLFIAGIVTVNKAQAQRFNSDNITISATTTTTTTTTTYNGKGNTNVFSGKDLGMGNQFDQSTGSLTITGITASANSGGTDPGVTRVRLYYRVYSTSVTATATSPQFNYTNLSTTAATTGSAIPYSYSGQAIDLLHLPTVLGGGNYKAEIYYELLYDDTNGSGDAGQLVTDPGNNANGGYIATFSVVAPAVTPNGGTTTWVSTNSTDWTVAANWSNGVPTRNADAIIPEKTPGGVTTVTPALIDPNATYEVRTITLNGTTNSTRALLRIGQSVNGTTPVGATLHVYGDLNTYSGGILGSVSGTNGTANPATNSTIILQGSGGYQVVRGVLDIVDFQVDGSSPKAVINSINASNTFTFASTATAVMQTSNDDATKDASSGLSITMPSLNTTKTAVINLKDSGFMFGETRIAYVRGITIADRALQANKNQPFGNIGVEITPNRDIPSPNVNITRTVGDPLFGPLGSTSTAPAGSPQPVKRQYGISGDVNNNTTSTIVFHYLDSTDELNGNPEANLTIFKTSNNAPPYSLVGGTVNTSSKTVTRVGYFGSLNTITLGDRDNPLPVQLVAFNAVRSANNALLTWSTASELNNKGFNVQVSADGVTFRALNFVASQNPTSANTQNYKYTDSEEGKVGTRYYRLEQVDLDGKLSYSPVRALNFDGATASAVALVAYPNPFNNSDQLGLTLQGLAPADGVAYVKIIDMAGRTIRDQQLPLSGSSISLGDMSSLGSGLYVAKVTLTDGTTQMVRIQKR